LRKALLYPQCLPKSLSETFVLKEAFIMAKRKTKQRSSGSGMLLLMILGIAGVLGGWNYNRNIQLEETQLSTRPFQGYSDEALIQLIGAYQEEADILDRKYRASLETRGGVRDPEGLIMEKIGEFERVQKIGASIRVATSKAADREARIREIRDEQNWRRNEGQVRLHLKRLTSI
jgi:hypothetical protein